MSCKFTAAVLAILIAAPSAMAEQYVVQINTPFEGANKSLLESLKITEIDAYTLDGAHFVVIEASNEGYLEAYFYAIYHSPMAIHTIGADWTGPGLAALSIEQRLPFLAPANCEFCEG